MSGSRSDSGRSLIRCNRRLLAHELTWTLSDGSLNQLGRRGRRVFTLPPDVPHERLVAGDVAVLVEADCAEQRVEFIAMERRGDRVGFERAGFLNRLRPELNGSVAVDRSRIRLLECPWRRAMISAARGS